MLDYASSRTLPREAGDALAVVRRLDWLLREPFSVFVIETGANDGLLGIPVAMMRSNIAQIIDREGGAEPRDPRPDPPEGRPGGIVE